MGITNTIGRAELAAVIAAILHGHSYIVIDSLSSLHQIRNHLLYPELHHHHLQGDTLKILKQTICNSPNPVHLFKVKSHAGIAGNECADAVAKYQATQVDTSHADTGKPCAGIGGNPFHDRPLANNMRFSAGMTDNIGRAELAAIDAAIAHGH